MNFQQELARVQQQLKAPKSQFNKFGNYSYRSCEDILEAYKKVETDLLLAVTDDIVEIGGRVFVKATAVIQDSETSLETHAYAELPTEQKGMSLPQITGSASSYARKYALNGLLLCDDVKDDDHNNKHESSNRTPIKEPSLPFDFNGHPKGTLIKDLPKDVIKAFGENQANYLAKLTDPKKKSFAEKNLKSIREIFSSK